MITQGAEVSGRCADCGGTTTCDVGQFVDHGTLSWTVEGRCADCSSAWCEQGEGPVTPESIRQALLQEHGPTRLRLTGDALSLVPVLRSLRALHGLSLGKHGWRPRALPRPASSAPWSRWRSWRSICGVALSRWPWNRRDSRRPRTGANGRKATPQRPLLRRSLLPVAQQAGTELCVADVVAAGRVTLLRVARDRDRAVDVAGTLQLCGE